MPGVTLESLAERLAAVEKELAERRVPQPPIKDWRSVVGMFDDDPEFMETVIAEALASREAERVAAREERSE